LPELVQGRPVYRFGVFRVDLEKRELHRKGLPLRIQEKPFQMLALLLQRPGEVVTREELRQSLWPAGTFVEFDASLNAAVKKVRAALDDSAENPRFIETIPKRGWRFIAPVEVVAVNGDGASPTDAAGLDSTIENTRPRVRRPLVRVPVMAMLVVGAVAVAALLILKTSLFSKGGSGGTPSATDAKSAAMAIRSIAVLPLENLSGNKTEEYFADGMTDELTTRLAQVPGLRVISRTSAMQYKSGRKRVSEIGKELGVDAVVEGTLERSGNHVRLRAQLIDVAQDRHLWAETYDRELNDILTVESDLARSIAREVQLRLSPEQEAALAANSGVNPQAFEDYLQGRHYWATRSREGLQKAVEYFNQAIAKDPNSARSYAGLAQTYLVRPMIEGGEKEFFPKARDAANRAIQLDDSLAEAHLAAAEVKLYLDWDFAGAEKEFMRTLELNPNYATGHQWYGEFLSLMSRHQEALREIQTAIALDPLSAVVHLQAGTSLQQARQYERALEQYREALRLEPTFDAVNHAMYWTLRRQGKYADSANALTMLPRPEPSEEWRKLCAAVGAAYAAEGKAGYLRASLALHNKFSRPSVYVARDYADLGNKSEALASLQRAYNDRDLEILWLRLDPEFDSLHSDPAFVALLKKTGLPEAPSQEAALRQ